MKKNGSDGYNIRQVIELTGVSEFTLRGWENRYRAFRPERTETGRRIFSQHDILKLKALKDLVDRGHRIGNIANLPLRDLEELLATRNLLVNSDQSKKNNLTQPIAEILKLADQHEWDKVRSIIAIQKQKLRPKEFILIFLTCILKEVGHQVFLNQLSIAQEHIISSLINESLYTIRAETPLRKKSKQKTQLVLATPEGDFHEIGLLMASTLAKLNGVQSLYLGANVPKQDICETCLRYQATHLLLSSAVQKTEGAKEDFLHFINFIDRHLPSHMTIWIAGRNGETTSASLSRNFEIIKSLHEFDLLTQGRTS